MATVKHKKYNSRWQRPDAMRYTLPEDVSAVSKLQAERTRKGWHKGARVRRP